MNEVPESSEKNGALVMKIKHNLISKLRVLLFQNTSDSKGGEQVRDLFKAFHDSVFKVNPMHLRKDSEIRVKQKKIEGVAAPLGDSSENSQLLRKLLYEKYQGMTTVSQIGKASRHPITVEAPVDQLLPISEALVNNVEETLRGIVQDAINESLSKFPTLKQAVEAKVVNNIFDTKRDQTIEFIKQFLQMQKMSTDVVFAPVPLPSELGIWDATLVTNSITERTRHPSMISKTMNHMKHLSSKLYPYDVIRDIETTGTSGNYKEIEDMKKIKMNVVRCFNVIKMNVCDTVPRCILHFFITELVDGLSSALEEEDLVEFLQEKQEIRDKRKLYRDQQQALGHALPKTDEVLKKLLHMRQGPSKGKKL